MIVADEPEVRISLDDRGTEDLLSAEKARNVEILSSLSDSLSPNGPSATVRVFNN